MTKRLHRMEAQMWKMRLRWKMVPVRDLSSVSGDSYYYDLLSSETGDIYALTDGEAENGEKPVFVVEKF